jgi:hypothetical protein
VNPRRNGERKRGNLFEKNRIMIRPKDDGTYMTGAFRSKLILRGTISPALCGQSAIPSGIDQNAICGAAVGTAEGY